MGCRRSLRKSGLLTCSVHARQVEGATAMNIAAGNGNRRPGASADTLPGRSAARDSSLLGNQPNLQERQRRLFFGKCQSSFQTPFVTVTCLASPSPALESQVIPHAFHCNTLAPTIILLGALAPCLTSLLLDLACIGAFVSVCLVTRAGRPTSIRFRKTETQFPKTGAHRDLPCVAFPCP